MTELGKIFKHISRDLLVYFLTGFIVIVDFAYLDYLFNSANTYDYVKTISYWVITLILVSYVIGHIVFAFMYLVFEQTKLEGWVKRKFVKVKDKNGETVNDDKGEILVFEIDYKKEIAIFTSNKALHEQFVERHTQLYLMRWNLSGGLIICGLTNIIFEILFLFTLTLTILSIILILLGFLVYILSLRTEKDCYDRINEIKLETQNSSKSI